MAKPLTILVSLMRGEDVVEEQELEYESDAETQDAYDEIVAEEEGAEEEETEVEIPE